MAILSPLDRQLLDQHQVQIAIDHDTQCGIIIFDNRRLTVSLLSRKREKGSDWKSFDLEENEMKETAGKVAVMLLKKEFLQSKPPEPLNFKINHVGIAFTSKHQFIKHALGKENTLGDFNALASYLNPFIPEEKPFELFNDDFSDDDDESSSSEKTPAQNTALLDSKSSNLFDDDLDGDNIAPKVQQPVLVPILLKKKEKNEEIELQIHDHSVTPLLGESKEKIPSDQEQPPSPTPVIEQKELESSTTLIKPQPSQASDEDNKGHVQTETETKSNKMLGLSLDSY